MNLCEQEYVDGDVESDAKTISYPSFLPFARTRHEGGRDKEKETESQREKKTPHTKTLESGINCKKRRKTKLRLLRGKGPRFSLTSLRLAKNNNVSN